MPELDECLQIVSPYSIVRGDKREGFKLDDRRKAVKKSNELCEGSEQFLGTIVQQICFSDEHDWPRQGHRSSEI